MSDSIRIWTEISFNSIYLVIVWGLVIGMWLKYASLPKDIKLLASRIILAFAFLALGDTGHVGFRIWAYLNGDLEMTVPLLGEISLVGLGALSTAITVTFFYIIFLGIWRIRFHRKHSLFTMFLWAAALVCLVLMAFPQNEWGNVIPPQPWSLNRNLPLMVQGLGVAYLILQSAIQQKDRLFQWIGVCILLSFGFYLPVILLVQRVPVIGMLMIPKTLAYLAIAVLFYQDLFNSSHHSAIQDENIPVS